MKTIEFLYDFGSPNAYLVHKVLPDISGRSGAPLRYVPILLGGVFKATNNQAPMMAFGGVNGKLAYQATEIRRFIRRHGIAFEMNPHFPVMTVGVMRGAIFARGKDWESRYVDAVFDAMWVTGRKMDDPAEIADVLSAADLPAQDIVQGTQDPDVKQALIDETAAAVARGVFGAPTMFVGDEMFFGKDSLPDLERELARNATS